MRGARLAFVLAGASGHDVVAACVRYRSHSDGFAWTDGLLIWWRGGRSAVVEHLKGPDVLQQASQFLSEVLQFVGSD